MNVEAAAKETLAGLENAATNAKAAVDADTAAEKAAKANLSSATDAVANKDAELASLQDMKSRMTIAKDTFEPLKAAKAESKRTLSALTKCFGDAGLEDGLVESLQATLKKEPSARGTYDGIVFTEVDAFMVQKFAELESSITAWQPVKDTLVKEKETAEAAHVASMDKVKASHSALSEAELAKKEEKKAHTTAAAAVASFEGDMAKAGKALEKANSALVTFQEGPKKFFEALQHLAPPPEPEPEVVETATTDAYGAAEAAA
jgi:chromosome segregation ATPase